MYVSGRSTLSNDNNMYSDLSGKPLSALAPNTVNLSASNTLPTLGVSNGSNTNNSNNLLVTRNIIVPGPTLTSVPLVPVMLNTTQTQQEVQEVQEIKAILEERLRSSQNLSEQPEVIKIKEVMEVREKVIITVDDHQHKYEEECIPAYKPACAPKTACNNNYAWGAQVGSIILWSIIFTVLFWLIFYSLKPAFVLQTDSNQVDTAKVLLAAVIAALILVGLIVLIKFAINRSRVTY